ncbi:MAG: GNAT family N-acetyltransferase [Deltaproteobacteria bacterium]|nr:GNAT family N-acetyltransferase [Deltaproteobacteria bacterium]
MSEVSRQASAKVLAATMTLMAREMGALTPPLSLWMPQPTAIDIKDAAQAVISGQAVVLWVDDSHPAMGLAVCQTQPLESLLLGQGSLRLIGPYMVEPDSLQRYQNTKILAAKAKEVAKISQGQFLSIKTWHDGAILRALIDEGFQMAEIGAKLTGTLDFDPQANDFSNIAGVSLRKVKGYEIPGLLDEFGELFYDGHLKHGPYLPSGFQNALWREVALTDFKRKEPFVFLFQDRPEEPIGLAWGAVSAPASTLRAIHVSQNRRGQGLGAYLLKALFKQMNQLGAKRITVETASWNLPALRLYQALGLVHDTPLVALHYKPKS